MIMHYSVNRVNYYSKYDTKYEWGMEEASGEWSIVLCSLSPAGAEGYGSYKPFNTSLGICIYIYDLLCWLYLMLWKKGKRQKVVYHLVTAPQGGIQKYTLAFAYDSPC